MKKIKANFNDNEITRKGFYCSCLSLILIDFCFQNGWKLLSTGLFRRMYIQHQRNKDKQIDTSTGD